VTPAPGEPPDPGDTTGLDYSGNLRGGSTGVVQRDTRKVGGK